MSYTGSTQNPYAKEQYENPQSVAKMWHYEILHNINYGAFERLKMKFNIPEHYSRQEAAEHFRKHNNFGWNGEF